MCAHLDPVVGLLDSVRCGVLGVFCDVHCIVVSPMIRVILARVRIVDGLRSPRFVGNACSFVSVYGFVLIWDFTDVTVFKCSQSVPSYLFILTLTHSLTHRERERCARAWTSNLPL